MSLNRPLKILGLWPLGQDSSCDPPVVGVVSVPFMSQLSSCRMSFHPFAGDALVIGLIGDCTVMVDRGWDGDGFGSMGGEDDDDDDVAVTATDSSSLMDLDAKKIPGRNPLDAFVFSGWVPLLPLALIVILDCIS